MITHSQVKELYQSKNNERKDSKCKYCKLKVMPIHFQHGALVVKQMGFFFVVLDFKVELAEVKKHYDYLKKTQEEETPQIW